MDTKRAGERIRELRRQRGMTQVEFAAQLGFVQPYVAGIENGTNPATKEMLMDIAEFFGVPLSDLTE